MRITVEEFQRVSTRASPCVSDVTYSQTLCYEDKILEYKIQRAGCYFPPVTGYEKWGGKYPGCHNASSYNNFMFWHQELYNREQKYDELQEMKDECGRL